MDMYGEKSPRAARRIGRHRHGRTAAHRGVVLCVLSGGFCPACGRSAMRRASRATPRSSLSTSSSSLVSSGRCSSSSSGAFRGRRRSPSPSRSRSTCSASPCSRGPPAWSSARSRCLVSARSSSARSSTPTRRRRAPGFKRRPENKGKLFTGGLFAVSMHPNYFGDLLWVSGYALRDAQRFLVADPGVPVLLLLLLQRSETRSVPARALRRRVH